MSSLEPPIVTLNGSPISRSQPTESTPPQPYLQSTRSSPGSCSVSTYSKSEIEAYRATLPKDGPPPFDFTYATFDYNLIVYHYKDVGVLVQAVPSYEVSFYVRERVGDIDKALPQKAVDIAIQEFPDLANYPREDIAIGYETSSSGKKAYWRISESAWPSSARKFQPRTKLHIAVRGQDKMAGPSLTSGHNPPPYESSVDKKPRARSESPRGPLKSHPPVTKKKSGGAISSWFKRS
jgi:hypothetical protein